MQNYPACKELTDPLGILINIFSLGKHELEVSGKSACNYMEK